MNKQKDAPKTTKRNPKDNLEDYLNKIPKDQECEVYEAQIDRIRNISAKNDKAK
jgi:hypothetical protein